MSGDSWVLPHAVLHTVPCPSMQSPSVYLTSVLKIKADTLLGSYVSLLPHFASPQVSWRRTAGSSTDAGYNRKHPCSVVLINVVVISWFPKLEIYKSWPPSCTSSPTNTSNSTLGIPSCLTFPSLLTGTPRSGPHVFLEKFMENPHVGDRWVHGFHYTNF